MNVSLPSVLCNVTILILSLTNHCSLLAVGYEVWQNESVNSKPTPGNVSNNEFVNLDSDGDPFWTNGVAPEWIKFWRGALRTVLPNSYLNFIDNEIVTWTNDTNFFYFLTVQWVPCPQLRMIERV